MIEERVVQKGMAYLSKDSIDVKARWSGLQMERGSKT